jgi:hypothetical protein
VFTICPFIHSLFTDKFLFSLILERNFAPICWLLPTIEPVKVKLRPTIPSVRRRYTRNYGPFWLETRTSLSTGCCVHDSEAETPAAGIQFKLAHSFEAWKMSATYLKKTSMPLVLYTSQFLRGATLRTISLRGATLHVVHLRRLLANENLIFCDQARIHSHL